MESLINKIHNCKNQDILPLLPDKSISVFLEDMPYHLTNCYWDKNKTLKNTGNFDYQKLKIMVVLFYLEVSLFQVI